MLVIEKPSAESLHRMVTNNLEELGSKSWRNSLNNYWDYFKTKNAIVSFFVISNWMNSDKSRKRAIFLLVGHSFLLKYYFTTLI